MSLLRKLAQWKFWATHDSYLHFKKKFFSFFVIAEMVSVLAAQDKVSNGVAFHWRRKQLPLPILHPIFLQHKYLQKERSYSYPLTYTVTEKWVWLSRIHQLHSYAIRKHTSLIPDSNLTLSCRKSVFDHLNKNSGTSVKWHHAIAGYSLDLLGG